MKIIITLEVPVDATPEMMLEYVDKALRNQFTRYMDDHPLAGFDPSRVDVKALNPILEALRIQHRDLMKKHKELCGQIMMTSAERVLAQAIKTSIKIEQLEEL